MGTPLDKERFISLETFKKNGDGVKTPVWSAPLDGKLVVFTAGGSYKVKRLRNNSASSARRFLRTASSSAITITSTKN